MSESLPTYLYGVLQRYFGPAVATSPRMARADVEELLVDDAQRRLTLAESAAMEWARRETSGPASIMFEHVLVTSHGLLYAAALAPNRPRGDVSPSVAGGPEVARSSAMDPPKKKTRTSGHVSWPVLYYLSTTGPRFDPFVDRAQDTPIRSGEVAAVDSRYGHDLDFRWPLDTKLRRHLDAHETWIWI